MTAKEFLESKAINDGEIYGIMLSTLLNEFAGKVDVSRTFENKIEKDYKGVEQKPIEQEGYFIEDAPWGKVWVEGNKKDQGEPLKPIE